MKRTWWLFGVVVVALVLFALVFTQRKTGESEVIKIGAILPLTGDGAIYGDKVKKGMELAVDEVSKNQNSTPRIRIIYEDSKLDPATGVSAFRKLAQIDKVPLVIGPISSGIVLSVAPLANREKTVVLSPYASNPKITYAGEYIFRIYPSDATQGLVAAESAKKLGFRKAAVFYINSDYGEGLKTVFEKEFTSLGGEIVSSEACNTGETDFRSSLVKIKRAKPDFIFLPGNEKEMSLILIQKKELGITIPILSTDAFLPEAIVKTVGDAAEGVMFTTFYEKKGERYENFAKHFQEQYGYPPSLLESLGYDAMWVVAKVVNEVAQQKLPIEGEALKNALYRIRYAGVTGMIEFDNHGDLRDQEGRFCVKVVRNGNAVLLEL